MPYTPPAGQPVEAVEAVEEPPMPAWAAPYLGHVGSFGKLGSPTSPLYAAVGYVGTDDHGANPPVGTIAHLYAPLPSNTPLFTLAKLPRKLEIPPPPAEMHDVVYAEGWNQCCDAFFGGLPPQEPVVITITEKRESLTDEQERALCEAYCNTASDAYFKARPQLDSQVNRRTFYAGHRKAWVEYEAAHSITDKKD